MLNEKTQKVGLTQSYEISECSKNVNSRKRFRKFQAVLFRFTLKNFKQYFLSMFPLKDDNKIDRGIPSHIVKCLRPAVTDILDVFSECSKLNGFIIISMQNAHKITSKIL